MNLARKLLRHRSFEVVHLEHCLSATVATASLEPFNVTAQDPKYAQSVEPACLELVRLSIWQLLLILYTVKRCICPSGGRYNQSRYIQ